MRQSAAVAAGLAVLVAAGSGCTCGGSSPGVATATLGPEGGTLEGPGGVKLVLDPGALLEPTQLTIAADATGAPEQRFEGLSPVVAVTPHGTHFAGEARVELPFDATRLRSGDTPLVLTAEPGGRWRALPYGITRGAVRVAPVSDLSWFVVVACAPSDACSTQQVKLEYFDPLAPLPQEAPLDRWGMPSLASLPITQFTTLRFRATYQGPPADDSMTLSVGASVNLLRTRDTVVPVGATSFPVDFQFSVDPATYAGAGRPGGTGAAAFADLSGLTFKVLCPGQLYCFVPWDVGTSIKLVVRYDGPTPAFTSQPVDATAVDGQPASFSVAATGPGLAYQWQRACGGQAPQPLAGQTGSTLALPSVSLADDGCQYSVHLCATAGVPPRTTCVDSAAATLHVNQLLTPPVFTVQPVSQTAAAGQDATFSATATGHPAPTIAWFILVDPGGTGNVVSLPAGCAATTGVGTSTTATCTWTALRPAAAPLQVMARATNGSGSVGSAVVTLTVTSTAPAIVAGLTSQAVPEGSLASFTVLASGNPAPSYAWTLDGVAIPGCGSSPTCAFPAAYADSGKTVRVTVSNAAGSVSSSATLTVTIPDQAPVITLQPGPQSVVAPTAATFSAAASGVPAPTLQWQVNLDGGAEWADLPAATGTSYGTGPTQVAQSGWQFRVVATNQVRVQPDAGPVARSAVSGAALLTVVPFIPAGALLARAIAAGDNVSYAVAPDGGLWAWGGTVDAVTGQFDDNSFLRPTATRPVRVLLDADAGVPLADVVAVATARGIGAGSTYALHGDGTVSAWGANGSGQLGDRTTTDRVAPVKVLDGASPVANACAIAAANQVLVVLRSDDPGGSCAPGKARSAWVAGLLTGSSWGGTPVTGTSHGEVLTPVPGLPAGVPVAAVSGRGAMNSSGAVLLLLENGQRFAVGQNSGNELGAGTSSPWPQTLAEVSTFWSGAAEVALGGAGFSLARLGDGTVAAVGRNNEGELGDPDAGASLPRTTLGPVPGLAGVSAVAAGDRTALAVRGSELWLWGSAWDFLEGLTSPFNATAPARVGTGLGFTAISVGTTHALALGPGGVVYAFGASTAGALGNGQTSGHQYAPTAVLH